MRQWIKKTDRYEPALNEAASQWCLHNGTELDECRSKKPRDKGPAESLVNQTYRYYYSRICRDTFFSYDELNSKLDELNDMFNNRTRRNKTYKYNAFSRIKGIKKAFIHLQITRNTNEYECFQTHESGKETRDVEQMLRNY